jgi:phosphogluconate dehydratase
VNDFHAAGGTGFVAYTLRNEGLLHTDMLTAGADEPSAYVGMPELHGDELVWKPAEESADIDVLRPAQEPFLPDGGMRLVQGNLGRAIFKTSAVEQERWTIQAPAICFSDQQQVLDAFQKGELDRDCIIVVRFQGPRANGMPELHKLTPALGVVQDRGYSVALVTDGRMSGASGKIPAAIHVSPEALPDGPLARVRDGTAAAGRHWPRIVRAPAPPRGHGGRGRLRNPHGDGSGRRGPGRVISNVREVLAELRSILDVSP